METTIPIPQNSAEEAAALGFPPLLFGFTPDQRGYWFEPGLPWRTPETWDNPPLGRTGMRLIWHYTEAGSNHMAPRFPKGSVVTIAPVYEKENLVVGKVYIYAYRDAETGQKGYQMGRLEKIWGNCLWARADNAPELGLCWLLRNEPREAVWDVYEVTHYISYPDLSDD